MHGQTGRIIKLIISLGYFAADGVLRLAVRLVGRKPKATCTILYYHSVPDGQRSAFARQMDIVASTTQSISIEHIPQFEPGGRYSAITFDDGFRDTLDNALPELIKRKIPATVFVTVAYMGQSAEWWPRSAPEGKEKLASAEMWQRLPVDLISIGSHTLTHPHLPMLCEKAAKHELNESRVMLQNFLNRKISTFSFPYGDFNEKLIDWCREAGYERIFTSLPRNAFTDANEYISGRVKAEPTDSDLEFRLKLLGAYRWLPVAISWKRSLLRRSTLRA